MFFFIFYIILYYYFYKLLISYISVSICKEFDTLLTYFPSLYNKLHPTTMSSIVLMIFMSATQAYPACIKRRGCRYNN